MYTLINKSYIFCNAQFDYLIRLQSHGHLKDITEHGHFNTMKLKTPIRVFCKIQLIVPYMRNVHEDFLNCKYKSIIYISISYLFTYSNSIRTILVSNI